MTDTYLNEREFQNAITSLRGTAQRWRVTGKVRPSFGSDHAVFFIAYRIVKPGLRRAPTLTGALRQPHIALSTRAPDACHSATAPSYL